MKNTIQTKLIAMMCILTAILGINLLATDVAAADDDRGLPDATLEIQGEMKTGKPITAVFDLKGYTIPNGSYTSINVRTRKSPSGEKPVVKIGYPSTTLLFATPGTYELHFILNEVSKPSCGGVNAKLLLETTRILTISAP